MISAIRNSLTRWIIDAMNLPVGTPPGFVNLDAPVIPVVDVMRSASIRWAPKTVLIDDGAPGNKLIAGPNQLFLLLAGSAVNVSAGAADIWLRLSDPQGNVVILATLVNVPANPAAGSRQAFTLPAPIPIYPKWTLDLLAGAGGPGVNAIVLVLQSQGAFSLPAYP